MKGLFLETLMEGLDSIETGTNLFGTFEKSGQTILFTRQCCPPSLRESEVKSKELTETTLNTSEST